MKISLHLRTNKVVALAGIAIMAMVGGVPTVAGATELDAVPTGVTAAWIRDVRPTNLGRGDQLVVELEDASPRGPALVILTRGPSGADREGHPVTALEPLVLRARALGDGRVVVDIDAAAEARTGRDVSWSAVSVEVALTDTGKGDVWGATDGHRVWRTHPRETFAFTFFAGSLHGWASRVASDHPIRFGRHVVGAPLVAMAIAVVVALVLLLLVAPLTGVVVVWERKVAGRMQSRFGPNRVGPGGWLQWLADGIKLIIKEDLVPTAADPVLFRLSPYLMWMGVFATFVVLPLSQGAIVADLNVGVLYLSSVTTLSVIGIMMGGWASNSKWSLLGGMRSAAQIISYELPASLALLSIVVTAGTLSSQSLVRAQGGLPHDWFLFRSPFTFAAFVVYFISALAEGNRTPFDLPEAESELVAGYTTEYSGFRWSIFSLAEWTNIYIVGAIVSAVFLGGWNVPFVSADHVGRSNWLRAASLSIMALKVIVVSFVIIWIRWTLPRFRIDQLMSFCWKRLVPLSFGTFLASAAWSWLVSGWPWLDLGMRWSMFLIVGVGTTGWFLSRVIAAFRRTRLLHVGASQFALPFVERHLEKR